MAVIGGFPVGSDGRVHTTFGHNPSTLRLCSFDPNLQNIPRGTGSEIEKWVKEIFVCPPGHQFWAVDFSGIEAVLVGYFAGLRDYTRLAKLGVHAFVASHMLGRPADLSWSDVDLKCYFKDVKKDEITYGRAKRIVHASNYMTTPRKLFYEYPEVFPTIEDAAKLQSLYFELFPGIRTWHQEICDRVDGTLRRKAEVGEPIDPWTLGACHVTNPFGYRHEFYNVLDWEKIDGKWYKQYGEDAKRLVGFLPQSTAAGIIKRAVKRVWYESPWVGMDLRLLIHDEIFGESLEGSIPRNLDVVTAVMTEPIPELPLDPTWGMGEYLSIGVEPKKGPTWATMN